jgi:hypothetical protein
MDVRTAEPPAAAPPEVVARGRTLLRLREHGAGPEIEIAWPDGARRRERLHLILTRCHGMQLGLMTPEGRLYRVEDPPGTAWEINLDRFSGFIREARGRLATAERREIGRLRRHHGLTGNAVRIFPRTVDAAFFGGLGRLTGTGYGSAKTIRAHYRLTADRVEVGDVLIDGRVVTGQLALPAVTRSCGQY